MVALIDICFPKFHPLFSCKKSMQSQLVAEQELLFYYNRDMKMPIIKIQQLCCFVENNVCWFNRKILNILST